MKRMFMIAGLMLIAASATAFEGAWVVTTDYSSFGRLRGVAGSAPWRVSADLATIPGDAVARHHEGLLYVVGRGGSNLIQIYDPQNGFTLVKEFSLGNGLNPQDIAFDSTGEAYISCYDQAVLLRVDITTEIILGSYATAAYADADGLPETAWMVAVGEKLFVTCQKLDRNNWYAPTGPGQLLVFDMATESFGAPVDLAGANPYTRIETSDDGSELRVGCAGYFGLSDGGVESVDPVSGSSLGYVVTEAELGGDVTAFVTTGPDELHSLVSNASFVTSLRRIEPSTGQTSVLTTGSGYVHADIAYDGGFQLFVADRTAGASGLRVFDSVSGAELTSGVLPTGQPPFMIVLPTVSVLSPVLPTVTVGHLAMSTPFPNPCNPRATVALSGRPGAVTKVSVHDLRGRRVEVSRVQLDGAGATQWTFTGLDTAGKSLPSGMYRIVAQSGAGYAAQTVTLIK